MLRRVLVFVIAVNASLAYSWTDFKTSDRAEIRDILRHHRDLLDDYLIHAAEHPGVRINEAQVKYITVTAETGGEKVYTCELKTELHLSDGVRLGDTVEVDKLCEHVF